MIHGLSIDQSVELTVHAHTPSAPVHAVVFGDAGHGTPLPTACVVTV